MLTAVISMRCSLKNSCLFAAALFFAACSQKILDTEPLPTGGHIMRSKASTLSEPAGAATARLYQDAAKFCRRDGREASIKDVQTTLNRVSGVETAEAEFNCLPIGARGQSVN